MESHSLTLDEDCEFLKHPDHTRQTGFEQAA